MVTKSQKAKTYMAAKCVSHIYIYIEHVTKTTHATPRIKTTSPKLKNTHPQKHISRSPTANKTKQKTKKTTQRPSYPTLEKPKSRFASLRAQRHAAVEESEETTLTAVYRVAVDAPWPRKAQLPRVTTVRSRAVEGAPGPPPFRRWDGVGGFGGSNTTEPEDMGQEP